MMAWVPVGLLEYSIRLGLKLVTGRAFGKPLVKPDRGSTGALRLAVGLQGELQAGAISADNDNVDLRHGMHSSHRRDTYGTRIAVGAHEAHHLLAVEDEHPVAEDCAAICPTVVQLAPTVAQTLVKTCPGIHELRFRPERQLARTASQKPEKKQDTWHVGEGGHSGKVQPAVGLTGAPSVEMNRVGIDSRVATCVFSSLSEAML